jgi:hypothetical protein
MGVAFSVILPVVSFGRFQSQFHHFDVVPRSLTTLLRPLLKTVKDIDGASESRRVYSPVCIAIEVIDDFQNAPAAKPFERLDGRVFLAMLGVVDRNTDDATAIILCVGSS